MVTLYVEDLRKEFAYKTGLELRGYSVSFKENKTWITLRAWDADGQPIVAFTEAPTEKQAWHYFFEFLMEEVGIAAFKVDKYAKLDRNGNPVYNRKTKAGR